MLFWLVCQKMLKFSMTRQEKGDLLIQVTAWTCLTVFPIFYDLDKLCFNF